MRSQKLSEEIFIQKQSFILDSIKQNRNRVLFFLLVCLYVLLTILGTTDKDIFLENGIQFPLLNIELPLIAFYLFVPLIILALHFAILYLQLRHEELLLRHKSIKKFFVSMPLGIFDEAVLKSTALHKLISVFKIALIYFLPLFIMYAFWYRFESYQDSFYSRWHLFYIGLYSLIVGYFFLKKYKKSLKSFLLILILILLFLASLFFYYIFHSNKPFDVNFLNVNRFKNYLKCNGGNRSFKNLNSLEAFTCLGFSKSLYPKLELSGENLVKFDKNQLEVIQSLDKNKTLALLQPPFNASNRSFKFANFSNAILIRVNFNNSNLQGANLRDAQLQGADLWGAKLQGADLSEDQLQGAYSSNKNYDNFIDRIKGQIAKNSDIGGISKDILNKEKKKKLIKELILKKI